MTGLIRRTAKHRIAAALIGVAKIYVPSTGGLPPTAGGPWHGTTPEFVVRMRELLALQGTRLYDRGGGKYELTTSNGQHYTWELDNSYAGRKDHEERLDARAERLSGAAQKKRADAAASFERSTALVAGIPGGQPVLVGHHSERRHRKALDRSWAALGAAVEAEKRADELARRAAAVGSAGISSDDPRAIELLTEKLEALVAQREGIKAANKAARAAGKPGIPAYKLTNLGATIRQTEQRLAELRARKSLASFEDEEGDGWCISADVPANRLAIYLNERTDDRGLVKLRSCGFKWAPSCARWQRQLTSGAVVAARDVIWTLFVLNRQPAASGEE